MGGNTHSEPGPWLATISAALSGGHECVEPGRPEGAFLFYGFHTQPLFGRHGNG